MKKSEFDRWIWYPFGFYMAAVCANLIGEAILDWFGILKIDAITLALMSILCPLACGILFVAMIGIAFFFYCAWEFFHRCRRDLRIIRQVQDLGAWDKPMRLKGRALELKAWQLCGLRREPGETDQQLRRRLAGKMSKAAGQPGWKERMLRHFLRGH